MNDTRMGGFLSSELKTNKPETAFRFPPHEGTGPIQRLTKIRDGH